MSLARHSKDSKRARKSRSALSDVYRAFTDRFGTADRRDAKALLESL